MVLFCAASWGGRGGFRAGFGLFVCLFVYCCCSFIIYFEMSLPNVFQAGLELMTILLSQPLKSWDLQACATTPGSKSGTVIQNISKRLQSGVRLHKDSRGLCPQALLFSSWGRKPAIGLSEGPHWKAEIPRSFWGGEDLKGLCVSSIGCSLWNKIGAQ